MDNTLRYLIVEDDDFDRISVETEADKFPFLKKIAACTHPLQAAELIKEYQPDILFLDIEMPGINGLQLARMLAGQPFLTVFITSHPEFAIEGFDLDAFDYLIKPLSADRFARCANRLRDFTQLRSQAFAFEKERQSDVLVIKQGHDKCKIQMQDILYLEAMKDYTRIVLKDKQYLVLTTLSNMQEQLPAAKFVRIHRSYIVHTAMITAVKAGKVELPNTELPVGKLYRNALKGILMLICWLLCVLPALKAQQSAPTGAPNPKPPSGTESPTPNYKSQMSAEIAHCDSLRLNASANYEKLKEAGLHGLALTRPDDIEDQSLFDTYAALGYYYANRQDSAQYYFYQSLYKAQAGHYTHLISRACVVLIPVNFQLQQPDRMDSCKAILQSIVDTARDRGLLEDGYYALGGYYQYKSYYSTAQDYFIRSIELREKEVDSTTDPKKKFDFAIQCDMLSKLYLNTGMVDKSLDALRKGSRFASISPNVANRLSSSFVEAFTSSGKIDSALYYDRRLDASVGNPMMFPSEVVSSDLNIAIYYLDRKEYAKVPPYLASADTVAQKVQMPFLLFQVQMTKARYLEGTGKYQAAIDQLQQSLPVAEQLNKELYGNDLKYMAIAQEGKGDIPAALRDYKQYVDVTDSLNKEKISHTFADLETHYQTYEKEQRINSLDKENRLHLLELENATRTRLLLVIGLAALGIISLLLYFIYRNKERLNRLLNERNDQLDRLNGELGEANETKARLFGIIGHDLRSPVSKIVRLLQLQKERPDLFTEEGRRWHEQRLKKASENVLETMEDLLVWSKSQMQHFHPELGTVWIKEIIEKEITLLQEQLEDGEVQITNGVPASLVRETDENFLSIIIRNLLQNAVRYCDGDRHILIASTLGELTITNPSTAADARMLNDRVAHTSIGSGSSGLGLQLASDLAVRIHARLFFRGEKGVSLTAVLRWESSSDDFMVPPDDHSHRRETVSTISPVTK